jgi:hypothetical protein
VISPNSVLLTFIPRLFDKGITANHLEIKIKFHMENKYLFIGKKFFLIFIVKKKKTNTFFTGKKKNPAFLLARKKLILFIGKKK